MKDELDEPIKDTLRQGARGMLLWIAVALVSCATLVAHGCRG